MTETAAKIALLRQSLERQGGSAVRLRGVDWFSWATSGGSSVILFSAETGIADVLVTPEKACILTNVIERDRLRDWEVPGEYELISSPWQSDEEVEKWVRELAGDTPLWSDRPRAGEHALPPDIVAAKRRLMPEEVERYRELGKDAAEAMRETLASARPEWTELRLAAEGARAMLSRGVHPALTLAAGESCVTRYRHPFPTPERLGDRAMLVFCGRRYGLYANLTRFVYFRPPTSAEESALREVATVEAVALSLSKPGARLGEIYEQLNEAYRVLGHAQEINAHHQGGTTGYLAREVVAAPGSEVLLEAHTAVAWNPSLPGSKIEDTVLCGPQGMEILTFDRKWPTFLHDGRNRPGFLIT